nr:FABP family protein [Pseudonocardiales bacterium]
MINPSQPGPDDGGLEAAEHVERAAGQLPAFDDLPIDLDRVNQWLGLELHPQCQPLSPLLGVWRGEGEAEYPSLLGQFRYGQQITWG